MDSEDSKAVAQLKELGARLEELKTSQGWADWLRLVSRLHSYSVNNTILIWSQKPDASMVMGYKSWQKVGRQVRRGEKGIKIFAPMSLVDRDSEDGARKLRFRAVSIFDISQTDGQAIEDSFAEVFNGVRMSDAKLLQVLLERVEKRTDLHVVTAYGRNSARGWYVHKDREITLVDNAETTDASRVRTLLHELGHAHDPKIGESDGNYLQLRGEYEMIAEASAWLASRPLGVDMDEASALYLGAWKVTDDQLLDAAARVIAAWRATTAVVSEQGDTDEGGAA